MSFPFRNLFRQQRRWERRLQRSDGQAHHYDSDEGTVSCSTVSWGDEPTQQIQRSQNGNSNIRNAPTTELQNNDSFDDMTLVTLPEDTDQICLLFAGLEDEQQQEMELRALSLSLAVLDQSSSTVKSSPLPPMVVTETSDEKPSTNTTQKPSKTSATPDEIIGPLDDAASKTTHRHTRNPYRLPNLPPKALKSDDHLIQSEREGHPDSELSRMEAAKGMFGNRQRSSTTGCMDQFQEYSKPPPSCSVDASQERRPVGLYLYGDEETLTGYECLIRKQLEFFEPKEASPNSTGCSNTRMVVGLRCRHCAHIGSKSIGGMVYPVRPDLLAETAHKLVTGHLLKSCPYVSDPLRKEIRRLMHGGNQGSQSRSDPPKERAKKSPADDSNEATPREPEVLPPRPPKTRLYPRYWLEAAMECGIVVSQSKNSLRWSTAFKPNPFGQRKLHRRYYNYRIGCNNLPRRRHRPTYSDPLQPY